MAAQPASSDEQKQSQQKETIIFQLGTNNWQVKDEPTSGSGILHESHHNAYNAMPDVYCYSIWPSGNSVQTTESYQALFKDDDPLKKTTRVYPLDGNIPVCESNHPGSSRRWHSMTKEARKKYYTECMDMVYEFLDDIETKYQPGKKISLIIVHHTFLNPVIMSGVLKKREENGKSVPPVAVFIHGTGIKMYQHEIRETTENMDEKQKEFVLKETPVPGVSDGSGKTYKTFLEWIRDDMGMFECKNKFYPQLGYAISPKSLAAFSKVFPNFPQDRLIMSPNGIDTNVVKEYDLKINDVLKDLMTFPAEKDVEPKQVPLKSPTGENWSHLIIHVSKMADWKRPDSVLYAFSKIIKEYPNALLIMIGQGTPEVNIKYQTLCNKTLGLGNQCFFVGQKMLSELARFYSVANVGIFPSKDEPFGMVFIECMICGTPAIGANSGGPRDFMIMDDKDSYGLKNGLKNMCTTGALVEETDDNVEMGNRLGEYLMDCIKNDWKAKMKKTCLEFKDKYTVDAQCANLLKDTWKILNEKTIS